MTDAEILAEGAEVGTWLPAERVNTESGGAPRAVAIVGGLKFDEGKLDAWLLALRAKYPAITVRTGSARGAEQWVSKRASELGLTVFTPEPNEFLGPDCEVTEALLGADAVVVVGAETGKRAALALAVHKRVDGWREGGRTLVKIAAPPTAKAPRRAPAVSRS